jgi:putative ABC transport system permease protein
MINKLVIENLKYRWVRTLGSALIVGILVASIITLIGLSRGMLEESAARAKGTGADIVLRRDTGATISLQTGQISDKFLKVISAQPHVVQAVGVLTQSVEIITAMNGVNIPEFEKISGGFHYLEGGPPVGPDDLVVDEPYARQKHLHVGDTVKLLNYDWHLSGIVEGGMLARFVVRLDTLQDKTGNTGRLSQIYVKLDDPARTDAVVDALNKKFAGELKAMSIADLVAMFSISSIPELQIFIKVITGMWVAVGFLVVFLSMYTAVVERTREIGILKALGAKPWTILDLLMREAILLALVGWLLGIGMAVIARQVIVTVAPASLSVINVPDFWPWAALIALTGAILGAIYPGVKAARHDAIEALSYE